VQKRVCANRKTSCGCFASQNSATQNCGGFGYKETTMKTSQEQSKTNNGRCKV